MKKILSIIIFLALAMSVDAQVVVTKFKFWHSNLYDFSQWSTDMNFKNTSDKTIKYLKVYYCAINEVGDAIASQNFGMIDENGHRILACQATGPVEPKKTDKSHYIPSFYYGGKKIIAFPLKIEVTYMGSKDIQSIDITRDNIGTYFPGIKWMDVTF